MKKTTEKQAVEVKTTIHKFEATIGECHEELTIVNGEIQETESWDSHNGGGRKKGESGFTESCHSTIRFIVNHNPKELKNIYYALADGAMKDFCKSLQQEKLAELNF